MFYVREFNELESTNDYAKLHHDELSIKDVIWAHRQTHGRGRFDRIWESNDDFTCSILFKKAPLTHTIMAPLAVAYALEALGYEPQIKWPNDILYQGKKCGGILVESLFDGNSHVFDIVGIGLNLTSNFQDELKDKAISLHCEAKAETVLYHILRMYELLLRMDEDSILREYKKYSMILGKDVDIDGVRYFVEDVNRAGELFVKSAQGTQIFRSEEISLNQIYEE